MFRKVKELIKSFRKKARDYLSYEESEFTRVIVNGTDLPANPDYIFLPGDKRPYFVFIYGKDTIVATGMVSITYQAKKQEEEKT